MPCHSPYSVLCLTNSAPLDPLFQRSIDHDALREYADASLGKAGMNTSTQLLCQRALRCKFQFQFTGHALALTFLVFANVGSDHLLDFAG
jgi:hypothetical protein